MRALLLLCALLPGARGVGGGLRVSLAGCGAVTRSVPPLMGRAERRASEKRSKKKGFGSPVAKPKQGSAVAKSKRDASRDVLSREAVLSKLREIPVFGLLTHFSEDGQPRYFEEADGTSCFFMDVKEAEQMCAKLGNGIRVNGVTLDEVYFNANTSLKPSSDALREASTVVRTNDVKIPMFAIDGLTLEDKSTGVASRPLFCSKSELSA